MTNDLTVPGSLSRWVSIGELKWDRGTRQLVLRGVPTKLSFRAAAVFGILVDARGEVVSREELERQVWGGVQMDYSVLSQCIKTLRRAIDPAPDGSSYVETVARVGYRLSVEVVEDSETPPKEPEVAPERRARPWVSLVAAGALVTVATVFGIQFYRSVERHRQADLLVEKAFQRLRRSTAEAGTEASVLLREALTIVPDYPPANAAMAESAARMGQFSFDNALELARRAVRDDARCSECQAILGYILGTRMWRWQEALPHLERAVELNPSRASHRVFLAEWLMIHGRLADAEKHATEATRLEPANPMVWSALAAVRFFQQRYGESIREGEHAAALDHRQPSSFYWQYRSQMLLGEDLNVISGRAKSVAAHSADVPRAVSEFTAKYQAIHQSSGRKGVAKAWLEEVGAGRAAMVHRYNRAIWNMWVGDHDPALAELEAGVQSRPFHMIYTAVDPVFAPLRSNPRFHKILEQLGVALILPADSK